MSFSVRLKEVMKEKKISQSILSERTGIGKSSISQYISGKNEPKEKTIKLIAEVLGVTEAYLLAVEEGNERNISIKRAAKLMAKSEQFVRVGLQESAFPFGTALKISTKWTYYISPVKFYDYVGRI